MSETLRWILICLAAVVLLGIYLWGRRGANQPSDDARLRARSEPTSLDELDEVPPEAEQQFSISGGEDSPPAAVSFSGKDGPRGRIEPTFGEDASATVELPPGPPADAPTLSLSDSPPPRRIERRKIIALRLAGGGQRFDGGQLRAALETESLVHGKYDVFHRLHSDGSSIFSVASMVEPGTFELAQMAQTQYPGVTLFAQLPGPVAGGEAIDLLVDCARRLQQSLGGSVQDERGIPLTAHRIERLREEVAEFERAMSRARAVSASQPAG